VTLIFDPQIYIENYDAPGLSIEATSATIADFTLIVGRSDTSQKVGDYSLQVTFVRETLEDLLAIETWTLAQFCQLGNKILIQQTYTGGKVTYLEAWVTDVQRDRDTITLSGVDGMSFRSGQLLGFEFGGYIGNLPSGYIYTNSIANQIQDETDVRVYDKRTGSLTSAAIIVGQTVTSVPAFLEDLAAWTPNTWIVPIGFGSTTDKEDVQAGGYFVNLYDRPNTLPSTYATFTDDHILDVIQYSRNISDAVTTSTVTNSADGWTKTISDQAAVDDIGYRSTNLEARIDQQGTATLAGSRLAEGSMRRAPIMTITTSWSLYGEPLWMVNQIIDVSGLTVGDFDGMTKAWIEKVVARYEGSDVIFQLTISDANYTSTPQTYAEVPALKEWDQVDPTLTWAEALISDIT